MSVVICDRDRPGSGCGPAGPNRIPQVDCRRRDGSCQSRARLLAGTDRDADRRSGGSGTLARGIARASLIVGEDLRAFPGPALVRRPVALALLGSTVRTERIRDADRRSRPRPGRLDPTAEMGDTTRRGPNAARRAPAEDLRTWQR
jgi:hypothetical protein